ncbi:MAG: phosphoenolpyruvate--protein phosphotransferase [Treponema sp.]|jgi:phosphotransferase system enzyme I (PtsI)|nr:phosphoenolpyruvate--protein phosphotransferase [Treponema sp.]
MKILQGISASAGIGSGAVFIVPESEQTAVDKKSISKNEVESQWERFLQAVEQVKNDFNVITSSKNKEQVAIFETYMAMIEDSVFQDQIKKAHQSSLLNIEYVVYEQYQQMADTMRKTGDDYLSQRADDICDVFGRVVNVLLNKKHFDIESLPKKSVVVAKMMMPTDAVMLEKRNVAAVVLEEGGVNSHFAILARNYGIPAVVGAKNILDNVSDGDKAIVDGDTGSVIINPDKAKLVQHEKDKIIKEKQKKELAAFKTAQAKTSDGTKFDIYANIGTPEEALVAAQEGADGIGLFRTEFLFMNANKILSEDEQFNVYSKVLKTMGKKPVTIRTLDAGADKIVPIEEISEADETNPLLGWRAIRISLARVDLFKTQLRALFRASVYGNLRIMFPLVCTIEELEKALEIVKEVKAELKTEKCKFSDNIEIGIMIETAASAIISDFFAEKADFFSVGTNDLTQYSIGVDRDNTKVSYLFDEMHPAIIRMIWQTVKNADAQKISISVCGEMASRPEGIAVLAGIGVRNFSMSASKINAAKELLSKHSIKEFELLAEKALKTPSASAIKKLAETLINSTASLHK